MSEYSKKAIYSALSGRAALTTLLGTDEDANPAIYNVSFNAVSDPPFPCVTFREGDGSADQRFRTETVGSEIFDLEAWARTESGLIIPRILEQIDAALHNQRLTLASGYNFESVRLTQSPDLYDDKLNLHFGLARYRLIVLS